MTVCTECNGEYDEGLRHLCPVGSGALHGANVDGLGAQPSVAKKATGIFASGTRKKAQPASASQTPQEFLQQVQQLGMPLTGSPGPGASGNFEQVDSRTVQPSTGPGWQGQQPAPVPAGNQYQGQTQVPMPAGNQYQGQPQAPVPVGNQHQGQLPVVNPASPAVERPAPTSADSDEDIHDDTLDMRFHVEKREDPFIGLVIADRYRIVSKLGTGGMGIVYKAQHLNIDRTVAIKMLHPHLVVESGAFQRFRQEAQAVTKAEHRNIVRIYDFGVSESHAQPYLVMDLIDGTSLRNVLKNDGPLPMSRAGDIFAQVVGALAAAHEVGVIHRDLKPENIMLSEIGNNRDFVSVVDFGISTMGSPGWATGDSFDNNSQPKKALGSPPYMSPEQCSGSADIDHRSDIYSLAIVLFETITGRLPFNARTQSQFIEAHLNASPMPLKMASEAFSACDAITEVIARALEKKPEKRYQTIEEFGNDLKEAIKRDAIRLNYLKNRKDLLVSSASIQTLPSDQPIGDEQHSPLGLDVIDPTLSETGSRVKAVMPFINCPHCNERVQRDLAFCLGCGRSLANPQEFSKVRAVTGVFTLPKQSDSLNSPVPTFSQKTRALSVSQTQRKAAKTLWIVCAVLAILIFLVAGGPDAVLKLANSLAHPESGPDVFSQSDSSVSSSKP